MVEATDIRIMAVEYFELPEYQQHDLIQLIDGEVIIGMSPILKHQDIVREILVLFTLHSRAKGGKAYAEPAELYLDEHNIYQPDVMYISPDSKCRFEVKHVVGAPDLVVEVLSPSTAKYDRHHKYNAYEANGVREYWIVDPVHEIIEVFALKDSKFERVGVYEAGDTFKSTVLAEDIDVQALFNLPPSAKTD